MLQAVDFRTSNVMLKKLVIKRLFDKLAGFASPNLGCGGKASCTMVVWFNKIEVVSSTQLRAMESIHVFEKICSTGA